MRLGIDGVCVGLVLFFFIIIILFSLKQLRHLHFCMLAKIPVALHFAQC